MWLGRRCAGIRRYRGFYPTRYVLSLLGFFLSCAASACSPSLFSPIEWLQSHSDERFSDIALVEVVAIRAPKREAELLRWRSEHLRHLEYLAEAPKREAEYAQRAAEWKEQHPMGPPFPPPESPLPAPILPNPYQLELEAELFVLEAFKGARQSTLVARLGGPCGQVPELGERVLAFFEKNGPTWIVHKIGPVAYDEASLRRIRACLSVGCSRHPPINAPE